MVAKQKLITACSLLAASMLPLLVEHHWRDVRLADPLVFLIALVTCGLCLWGAFAGRVAWVLVLIRAGLQVLGLMAAYAELPSHGSRADFMRAQGMVSLGLTVAAIWLLVGREVRALVWRKGTDGPAEAVRLPSRLAPLLILGGFGAVALLLGSVEQAWIYQHVSVLEIVLRSLYLVLPWAGAWLLARYGRDRVLLTTLGALLGELASESLSLVASGAEVTSLFARLMLPLNNLPALLVGLALALCGPRRPLWLLGLALPLAQLGYRAAVWQLTSAGSSLPWQLAVLAVLSGMGFAAVVYRFRLPPEVAAPVTLPAPPSEPTATPPSEPTATPPSEPAATPPSEPPKSAEV